MFMVKLVYEYLQNQQTIHFSVQKLIHVRQALYSVASLQEPAGSYQSGYNLHHVGILYNMVGSITVRGRRGNRDRERGGEGGKERGREGEMVSTYHELMFV